MYLIERRESNINNKFPSGNNFSDHLKLEGNRRHCGFEKMKIQD